ncbi:MAG: VOC family protein [Bacteroidetes bacterium]|nr:VOC family protein [Bacteroidota bacterium]
MATTQKIIPHLWFDTQAEQAVNFYTSIFKKSKIIRTSRYGKEGQEIHKMPEGTVMSIEFELAGQRYTAINGGPLFTFNESVSFMVSCKDQKEIDYYWEKLTAGGDKNSQQCGWLKDKYGLSWQIIPAILSKLVADKDPRKSQRVMKEIMKMKKIDLKKLKNAFDLK